MRYVDAVSRLSPAGVWLLDDPGTTTLARGRGPTGDATFAASGVTYRRPGPSPHIPLAVALNGSAGHVTLPAALSSTSWLNGTQTWEAWASFGSDITGSSGEAPLLGSGTASNWALNFGDSTGALTSEVICAAQGSGRTGWTSFTVLAGWHHHVITYAATANLWTYYLDGVARGTKVSASGGAGAMSTSATYYVGRQLSVYGAWSVAAVAVYPRTLSQAQIQANYKVGRWGHVSEIAA